MKVYCPDCGTKIEYKAAKKPNFCTNCGYKFAGAKVDPPPIVTPDEEYEDDYEETSSVLSNLTELDVDVQVSKRQGVTFGDVLGTAATENGTKAGDVYKRPDDGSTAEQQMNSFKNEASATRPNSRPAKPDKD